MGICNFVGTITGPFPWAVGAWGYRWILGGVGSGGGSHLCFAMSGLRRPKVAANVLEHRTRCTRLNKENGVFMLVVC